jgi:hypothetical protein
MHRARVTGYFPFDGLLQLSLKSSVLEQKFFQVGDVEVGEVIRGTIKKLTDTGLFVTLSGNIDGVVWPNHYADITLKQPSKRFKIGASIKCRVRLFINFGCTVRLHSLHRSWLLIQIANEFHSRLRRLSWIPVYPSYQTLKTPRLARLLTL